jgi:hypothetical protein
MAEATPCALCHSGLITPPSDFLAQVLGAPLVTVQYPAARLVRPPISNSLEENTCGR